MTTKYDVGDLIKVTFTARIIGYSINEDKDDSYTLVIAKPNGDEFSRVYVSSADLEQMDVKVMKLTYESQGDGTFIRKYVKKED